MRTLISTLLGKLKGGLSFAVLLAVAAAGAWMYVQMRQARADRDDVTRRVELICTGAGAPFAASATRELAKDGRAVTVEHARGALCQRRAAQLVAFENDTQRITAETLRKALADHDARQLNDNIAARTAAQAASAAAQRMEAADAEAERKNLVDREWFAAVNGVAGLRAPAR